MARPLRKAWRMRTVVRRRHRTWMTSMILATIGWGTWWVALAVAYLTPGLVVDTAIVGTIAGVFALPGLALAIFTIRARPTWLLFALVPLFANTSLLVLPWLIADAGVLVRPVVEEDGR